MQRQNLGAVFFITLGALASLALASCATSPLGRKQLMLLPEGQVDQMGKQSFQQLQQQTPLDTDPKDNAFVQCVANAITQAAHEKSSDVPAQWDIKVFDDKQVNAFALPGGEIGVYKGILPVVANDAQLAAVLGHEVGHVLAHHGNERMSQQLAAGLGMEAINAFLGGSGGGSQNQLIMAALGLGVNVGVLLPFSRTDESEADLIGEELMARAGFDPHQAIELWKNMMKASPGAPPEILSDHPADQNRIQSLEAHLPQVMPYYQQAQAAGKHPSCPKP